MRTIYFIYSVNKRNGYLKHFVRSDMMSVQVSITILLSGERQRIQFGFLNLITVNVILITQYIIMNIIRYINVLYLNNTEVDLFELSTTH